MTSRLARKPIEIPKGVELNINGQEIAVKGGKGSLSYILHDLVTMTKNEDTLTFAPNNGSMEANAMTGTMCALMGNMLRGVSQGFERKLQLVGVGYRAQLQGKVLNLTLGFSHPVTFGIPEGIAIEAPSQTDLVIKGADKQQVGQVAAKIRALRPPDSYKGKGVRYADEVISLKETKKK